MSTGRAIASDTWSAAVDSPSRITRSGTGLQLFLVMSSALCRALIHSDKLTCGPPHNDPGQLMRDYDHELMSTLTAYLRDVRVGDDTDAEVAVCNMSSYQLRNFVPSLDVDSLREANVLMSLMRRLQQPDQGDEEDWDQAASHDVAPMNPVLRSDLMKILKGATSSFPDRASFESFIQLRIRQLGYQAACSQEQIVRQFRAQNQPFGHLHHFPVDLIPKLQSYACIAPADTVNYLIRHSLLHEDAVPVVVRLISDELRAVAMARAEDWEESLIVSVISQAMLFGPGSEIPDKIVSLVTLLQEASPDDPVIRTEDLLIDWIGDYRDVDGMSRLIRGVNLLMERESDSGAETEKWDRIDVVHLCKFFVDCLLDVCFDSVAKDRFLKAICHIMKSCVQRKLTPGEIEDLTLKYHFGVNRLVICYLQPFTDVDIMDHMVMENDQLDRTEVLLIAAMMDRPDMHHVLPESGYPDKELTGILPFLTPVEFGRLFTYLIHFFEPTDMICVFLHTMCSLIKHPQVTIAEIATVLKSFEQVFREFYACGKNLIMLNRNACESTKSVSETESSSFDEPGYDSDDEWLMSRTRRWNGAKWQPCPANRKRFWTQHQNHRKPHSLFHVLHLMLRLQIPFFGTPSHETLESMITDFIYTTSHSNGEWSQQEVPVTAHYRKRKNLWHELETYQRHFLMQQDPSLKDTMV